MTNTDTPFVCITCNQTFTITASEQQFFQSKGFVNVPSHCKRCKAKRSGKQTLTEAQRICDECGAFTTVPFRPTQGRPVLCRPCFDKAKAEPMAPAAHPNASPANVSGVTDS